MRKMSLEKKYKRDLDTPCLMAAVDHRGNIALLGGPDSAMRWTSSAVKPSTNRVSGSLQLP